LNLNAVQSATTHVVDEVPHILSTVGPQGSVADTQPYRGCPDVRCASVPLKGSDRNPQHPATDSCLLQFKQLIIALTRNVASSRSIAFFLCDALSCAIPI